jgi:hypothetical protein
MPIWGRLRANQNVAKFRNRSNDAGQQRDGWPLPDLLLAAKA